MIITHDKGPYLLISKEDRDANFPIPNSSSGEWRPVDCNEGAFVNLNDEVKNFLDENDIPYSIVEEVTVTQDDIV
jgi:hypothetical protein